MEASQKHPSAYPTTLAELARLLRGGFRSLDGVAAVTHEGSVLTLETELAVLEKTGGRLNVTGEDLSIQSGTDRWVVSVKAFDCAVSHADRSLVIRFSLPTKQNPRKSVFLRRAIDAVHEIHDAATPGALEYAAGAPTNLHVLFEALESPEGIVPNYQPSPLERAKLRGALARRELLNHAGAPHTGQETANLLGLSRQAVDKRRRMGQLIAVRLGRRGYVYPSRQFTETGTLPGLTRVLGVLSHLDSWTQLAFFVNPNDRLAGLAPFDVLQAGNTQSVTDAAAAVAEHGSA